MQTFRLRIITPEKVFFEGDAVQIIARTSAGNVGILAGHSPYVANVLPSPLKIKTADGEESRTAAISSGIIKADKDGVSVVAEAVEWAEDIDVLRAQRARDAANKILEENRSQKEFERAEQRLKKALNRLTVAGR